MNQLQDVQLPIPAIKIRKINSEIRDVIFDIIPDKIIVRGIIHKQIFFVGSDSIVHHLSDDMPFSTFIDVPGARPGMFAQIDVTIEKIIPRISSDGRVIIQKAILDIFVKIEEEEVIRPALAPEGVLVELNQLIGMAESERTITNEIELNQIAIKIDEIRGRVLNLVAEVRTDQIVVRGIVNKQIFYVNQQNDAVYQAEEQDFEFVLDLPGALEGMGISARVNIEDIDYTLSPDGTTLSQRVILDIEGQVIEPVQVRVATGFNFLAKVPVVIGEDTAQIMKTSNVVLDQPTRSLLDIDAQIQNVEADILSDKVLIRGVIGKLISYIGIDDNLYQQTEEIPFETFINIEGASPDQLVRVEAFIEGEPTGELVNENQLRQEVVVGLFAKVLQLRQLYLQRAETGPEIVLPLVVTENNKQILVEQEVPPTPPVRELIVDFETIVQRAEVFACAQKLLDNIFDLPCPALKIKRVTADVENIQVDLVLNDLAVVTGTVVKDIAFVCDNLVQHIEEQIPFRIEIPLPQPVGSGVLKPVVTIEKIITKLLPGGKSLREIVVLKACVSTGEPGFQRLVTRIEGTGITTETILVREEIVVTQNPLVTEVKTFPVITDINDPLGLLTTVIKETLILNVVGEGRMPVEVIVFAE